MRPTRISRTINPKHLKRARMVTDDQVGPYLDQIVTDMHVFLDQWRFHNAPAEDFRLALDACIALFTEAETRGLA